MTKIIMYGHGGSENHGCEAIVRSTVKLLGNNNDYLLFSANPLEDIRYHLDELCKIVPEKNRIHKNSFRFYKAFIDLKVKNDYRSMDKMIYTDAFDMINKGDIALSIGGDNYCYADVERYILMHDLAIERGAKTVLWGCSIEPSLLGNKHIVTDLKKYDYIFARESITIEAVKSVNSNTIFMPDTAFLLDQREIHLPEGFIPDQTVGINISPMVINNEKDPGIVLKNYEKLIDYILRETEFNVALIPHVTWDDNNDCLVLQKLFDQFKSSNRIVMIPNQSCECLKYVISQCRYFVGARTHSTIAAYSSGVPVMVVGYSVKARGIAKDIFGSGNNYIVSCDELNSDTQLLNEFIKMANSYETIKTQLQVYNHSLPAQYNAIRELRVLWEK